MPRSPLPAGPRRPWRSGAPTCGSGVPSMPRWARMTQEARFDGTSGPRFHSSLITTVPAGSSCAGRCGSARRGRGPHQPPPCQITSIGAAAGAAVGRRRCSVFAAVDSKSVHPHGRNASRGPVDRAGAKASPMASRGKAERTAGQVRRTSTTCASIEAWTAHHRTGEQSEGSPSRGRTPRPGQATSSPAGVSKRPFGDRLGWRGDRSGIPFGG